MAPTVAERSLACITTMKHIGASLKEISGQSCSITHEQIIDELERFSLWLGNIEAIHPPESTLSLEMRLHDEGDVLSHIIGLLADLDEAVHELLDIASGNRENMGAAFENDPGEWGDVEAHNTQESELDEATELFEEMKACISRLFRASSFIHQTAPPTDLFLKALSRSRYMFNDQFDIAHVGAKFPRLASKESVWLRQRLGRAITQRRRYLNHIQNHRDKLEELPRWKESGVVAAPEVPITSAEEIQHIGTQRDGSSQPSTFVTTQILSPVVESDSNDDAKSYTTTADSTDGDLEPTALAKVPKLANLRKNSRDRFECPFCLRMQRFKSERLWTRHVFQDLRSYICTFPECDAPYFGDVNKWFQHEMHVHRVSYACPLCKNRTFVAKDDFLDHVGRCHPEFLENGDEASLIDVSREPLDQIPVQDCPCCSSWEDRLTKRHEADGIPLYPDHILTVHLGDFKRHLASHLEDLALFAVPIAGPESGETNSDAAIGTIEIGSLWSDATSQSTDGAMAHTKDVEDYQNPTIYPESAPNAEGLSRKKSNDTVVTHARHRFGQEEKINRAQERSLSLQDTNTLINILGEHGLDGVEAMQRQALDGCKKHFAKDHPSTLQCTSGLAIILEARGKYREAEELHRYVGNAAGYLQRRTAHPPIVLTTFEDLGSTLASQGRIEEAFMFYTLALSSYRRQDNLNDSITEVITNQLELKHRLKMIETGFQTKGHSSVWMDFQIDDQVLLAFRVAEVYENDERDSGKAIQELERVVEALRTTRSKEDSVLFDAYRALAETYIRSGQPAKAITLLGIYMKVSLGKLPQDHPIVLTTLYCLAEACHADGQEFRALKFLAYTVPALERVLPPQHVDVLCSRQLLSLLQRMPGASVTEPNEEEQVWQNKEGSVIKTAVEEYDQEEHVQDDVSASDTEIGSGEQDNDLSIDEDEKKYGKEQEVPMSEDPAGQAHAEVVGQTSKAEPQKQRVAVLKLSVTRDEDNLNNPRSHSPEPRNPHRPPEYVRGEDMFEP